jgi:soluble lytic murein transglycosylase
LSDQKVVTKPSVVPVQSRARLNLIFSIISLVASLAILALAIFVVFIQPNPVGRTTNRAQVAAEEIALPPSQSEFKIPVQPAPTGAPTVTVSPQPNEALRLRHVGDDFMTQGRQTEAAAQYRLILESYAQSAEAKPALYGLARAGYERGNFTESLDLFKRYVATYPADAQKRYALYYAGLSAKALSKWDEAIGHFQKYQAEAGQVLDAYAWFEIGDAYARNGKGEQAVEAYKKTAAGSASNLMRVTALERLGDYYMAQKLAGEAADWYGKILEIAKIPDYRAGIVVKQQKAYADAGRADKAEELNRMLIGEYLGTPSGFAALKTLYNANSPLADDYLRGYYQLQTQAYSPAITTLLKVLGRPDDKAAQPPTPEGTPPDVQNRTARAWFWLANAYEGKNDLNRAASEYVELAARLPNTPSAADALWRLARLQERQNKPDDALNTYNSLVDKYPAYENSEQASYNTVRLALNKSPEAAQPYADKLAQKYTGSRFYAQAYYDIGKGFQAKNDRDRARTAFEKAAAAPRINFYAIRASERLTNPYDPNFPPRSSATSHPAVYDAKTFAADIERDRADFEKWLLTWAAPTVTGTATPAPAKNIEDARRVIREDAGVKRFAELRRVGDTNRATREALEAVERYETRPLELYALALTLSENAEYYHSVSAANELFSVYQRQNPAKRLRETPLFLQKLMYPLPFQNMILEAANRNDFDPLLFVSLIKQESAFNPDATSSADARGLAQVIPSTARGIATALDKPNFKIEDLYNPYTALEFGGFYLSGRLKDFGGQPYEALAAYNGGAGNVERWSRANQPRQNFDAWVEGINFPETRQYVQIIYANYYLYRQIYAARK